MVTRHGIHWNMLRGDGWERAQGYKWRNELLPLFSQEDGKPSPVVKIGEPVP
jgi:hypothetical protein